MNVVLATNCLIMAISAQNEYYQVWHDFLEGKYCLCITNEIIEEYSEVLARNISPLVSEYIITAILNRKNVKRLSPSYAFHLIEADEDDNKFATKINILQLFYERKNRLLYALQRHKRLGRVAANATPKQNDTTY
ncbi:PIN domain-containing protein [uncultured Prevotella sp.]|uniref:PIN domain-containing protein n=1 Tax=uncultured Prevotella sp. TaxID=159272 RepID=UPI00345ADD60